MDYRTVTFTWDGIASKLITLVFIRSGDKSKEIQALWDTGCTNTCISKRIVSEFELVSKGKRDTFTASGPSKSNVYDLYIELPNSIFKRDIEVNDADIAELGFDMLIGLDIINLGDLAISNYNGKTAMSFRVPSICMTDYVAESDVQLNVGTAH